MTFTEDFNYTNKYGGKMLLTGVKGYDIMVKSGDGATIETDKGTFVDFWGDEGINSLGYGRLGDYVANYDIDGDLLHVPKMFREEAREELAGMLEHYSDIPGGVMFSNSGTEANEAAIKLVRHYYYYAMEQHYRNKILTFRGNFHGRTGFSLAVSDSYGSGSSYHKEGFGPMADRFGVFEDLEDLEARLEHDKTIAAVIMATSLGNNVIEVYNQDFFNKLMELRIQYGFKIILDEVQVGAGRTGEFFCFQNYDHFNPDVVTVGKGLGTGLPLSATIFSKPIADHIQGHPGIHFNTMGGNSLACNMAIDLLTTLEHGLLEQVKESGDFIRKQLRQLTFVDQVVGLGLHNAFSFKDIAGKKINSIKFAEMAMDEGLLIVSHREHGQIRFTPPLIVSINEIHTAIAALSRTFTNYCEKHLGIPR